MQAENADSAGLTRFPIRPQRTRKRSRPAGSGIESVQLSQHFQPASDRDRVRPESRSSWTRSRSPQLLCIIYNSYEWPIISSYSYSTRIYKARGMASSFKSTRHSRPTSAPLLPRSRGNASFGSQDGRSGSTKHACTCILKEVTETPTAVRVCSGNYLTYSGQSISKDTKLYLHKKVQRKVVQMRCFFPKNTRIVNLPLSTNVQVGFEHPTSNFKNVKQVVKEDKHLPKLLFVVRSCQCSPSHDISESNVLIVTGLTQKKELIVLNKYSQRIYHLSPKCKASFTTDPKQACVELTDLEFLDQSSLPWENVILKGSLNVFGSPQKNQSIRIENIFIEDCAIVQTSGQIEKHLIPLDAALEVEVIRLSVSSECEFPEDTYEVIDSDPDLVNQPTVMDFPRRGSQSNVSESSIDGFRPPSAMSGVSIDSFRPPSALSGVSGVSGEISIASSRSSHFSEAESLSRRMPPVVEGKFLKS